MRFPRFGYGQMLDRFGCTFDLVRLGRGPDCRVSIAAIRFASQRSGGG